MGAFGAPWKERFATSLLSAPQNLAVLCTAMIGSPLPAPMWFEASIWSENVQNQCNEIKVLKRLPKSHQTFRGRINL
ncbi:hypothetical protein L596_025062 [Steinernema carpocapsae]|uniref:Uncharacterized protein n=1 Tax=Steinernema carpocapsae TaxID=34508 RepID=A0A4U5M6P8_STECR|nr:hypothetical protein L596_025062 [Steinernema carpocapsae]